MRLTMAPLSAIDIPDNGPRFVTFQPPSKADHPNPPLGREIPLSAEFAAAMMKLLSTPTNAPSVGHVLLGAGTAGEAVPRAS